VEIDETAAITAHGVLAQFGYACSSAIRAKFEIGIAEQINSPL
jgi:hypothetical protein